MNTKIRINIWIVAFFLVFSGIGLSSQKAFAASGFATQRTADISVYRWHAMVSLYAVVPSSVGLLRQASIRVDLNANDIDESRLVDAYRLQAMARSSAVLPSSVALSTNDIDESRLIDAYRLQAIARYSVSATDLGEQSLISAYRLQAIARYSVSATDLGEQSLIDGYRWQAFLRFYTSYGGH
jgi:hypothetical protein